MSTNDRDDANDSSGDRVDSHAETHGGESEIPTREWVSPMFDEQARDFFAIMTDGSSDSSDPESVDIESSPVKPLEIRHHFGRFQVFRQLGSGGYGSVFQAFDPKLRREVALKLPNLNVVGSQRNQSRFLREAQAVSTLNHPNIIQVHDVDYVGSIPYIVSALCNGPSLAVWLAEQRRCGQYLSPQIAAKWLVEISSAIEYAHQHGIVHRDLKPGNILLSIEGAADDPRNFVPMVADFGFAKILNSETEFTQTGAILGTVSHMAPEQAEDPNCEVGPAVDIYSLGVVLYELLTGLLPIQGKNTAQLLQRLFNQEPEPPRKFRPEIPRDLEAVCLKCLAKSPTDRYSSAGELNADLQRFFRGEAVHARPIGRARRLARQTSRIRLGWKSILAVLTGLLTMAVLAIGLWIQLETKNESIRDLTLQSSASNQRLNEIQSARIARLRTGYAIDVPAASQLWEQATQNPGSNQSITAEMERLLQPYLPLKHDPDIRGSEWHFLWNASHPAESTWQWEPRLTIPAHRAEVFGLAFSNDGNRLASGAADRSVRIWNAQTGDLLQTLSGHTNDVNWTSWSPDGRLLATASDDRTVRVWDVDKGDSVAVLEGFVEWTYTSEFSPDGDRIAASDHSGLLKIWRTSDFKELHAIQAHSDRIRYLAWSPDGKTLTTASDESTIKIWDADSLTQRHVVEFDFQRQAVTVAYSSDSQFVAIGGETNHELGYDGLIMVLDVESGDKVASTVIHERRVRSLSFIPGRLVVVSTSDDSQILAWDLVTGQTWKPVPELPSRSRRLTFSRDGAKFAFGRLDGLIQIWDSRRGSDWTHVFSAKNPINCLETLPGTNTIFSGVCNDESGQLTKWDIQSPAPRAVATLDCVGIHGGHLSGDGRELFVGSINPEGPQISVIDPQTLQLRETIFGSDDGEPFNASEVPHLVAVPQQGSIIGILSDNISPDSIDWNVSFFDRLSKQIVSGSPSPGSSAVPWSPITVSLDGELFAIGQRIKYDHVWEIHVFDVTTQTEVGLLQDCAQFTMAFGRDDMLAIGESFGHIRIWDARNQIKHASLVVGEERINSLAFYPDGKRLVAGTTSKITVVTFPEGRELCRLSMPVGAEFAWHHKSMIQVTADGTIAAVVRLGDRDHLIAWRPLP